MRNIIDCFSSYDSTTWSSNLNKLDSGFKLMMEILFPALVLSLLGSCLPTSNIPIGYTVNLPPYSYMDILSPYTSHSAILSSSIAQTSTPIMHNHHPLISNFDPIYLLRMAILSLISPLSLDVFFNCVRPIVFQVLQRFKVVLQSRKRADHSTRVQLREKIKQGRVLQRHSHDLYLPPKEESSDDATTDSNHIKCLLLFPGFGIHHSAYADVASLISQYGIPVAVVSLEPLRLAHAKLGGSIQDVRRILKSAGRDVAKYYKQHDNDKSKEKDNESVILEWDVGGHSMGGYNSLQLAPVVQQSDEEQLTIKLSQNNGSISRIGSQIIVWGAGNLVDNVPNLQTSNNSDKSSSKSLRVLVLSGSNDDIAKFTSHRQKRDLLRKLPRRSKMQTIKGANHSGFASYDEASKKSSTFLLNGIRDIKLKDQQEETARRTADFLLNQ